jgi:hypothetical protein
MFRKIAIAAAAVAALGAASLAPASAKGFGGGFHGGFHGGHFHGGGFRIYSGVGLYDYDDGCYRRVWVTKRNGDVVLRTVNVCL